MKKIIPSIAILILLTLTACEGVETKAPKNEESLSGIQSSTLNQK